MTSAELAAGYSFVGDAITVIMGTCLLIMIRQSLFFSQDTNFRLFKRALHVVIMGALANILFYQVLEQYPMAVVPVFILRDINHLALLMALYIFILYVRNVLELKGLLSTAVTHGTHLLFFVALVLDMISPWTHFGFYRADGLWFDSVYIKPFTFAYIYAIVVMMVLVILCGRLMIREIRATLISVELVAAVILYAQNAKGTNSFTTFTFIMPMLVVFSMLHSKPYDLVSGALDIGAFPSYLEHVKKKHSTMNFVVLELQLGEFQQLPEELGKAIYSIWYNYFRKTTLFLLQKGIYVLAIEDKVDERAMDILHFLSDKEFPSYYQRFRIPYRVMVLNDIDSIWTLGDMNAAIAYFRARMKLNTVLYADEEDKHEIRTNRVLIRQLADIKEKNDINDPRVLMYCQPIWDNSSKKFKTAEVLMRMMLPEVGFVYPSRFIPLAEQNGYIHTLTRIILHKACIGVNSLLAQGYELERVSVNVAISEFHDDNLCEEIAEIIASHGLDNGKIGIELTESETTDDYQRLQEKIAYMKTKGICFYLDDFGTGYSNFDRALSLGMDVVKFDKSLVEKADVDEAMGTTLRYFSEALKRMNYRILFEGVETEEQDDFCKECGADYIQGFIHSKPVPFDKFKDYLEKS